MNKDDQEYLKYLQKQIFTDIDERSINGIYVYLATWLLVGGATGFYQQNLVFFWVTAIVFFLLGLIRLAVHLHYSKHQSTNNATRKTWLFFNVLCPAGIYSVLFSLSIVEPSFEPIFTYLLMAIFALVSTGAVIFAPMKKLSVAFLTALTPLPFICAVFLSGERLVEGLMLLLYSTYMFAQAIKLNREYLHNLKQRYKLNKLNLQDSLTGISNRRRFDEAFESAWKSALRSKSLLSLILIDIDYFKTVNDQYGHSAGDEVIKSIAQVIQSICQRDTDVVARLGGEEYAVLLSNYQIEKLGDFAEKIRQSIQSTETQSGENKIRVTASLGVTHTTAELNKSTKELFNIADKNLYAAKEQGRNRVIISQY
jgi:diguanylate cyclase (GGDEF)-like protein